MGIEGKSIISDLIGSTIVGDSPSRVLNFTYSSDNKTALRLLDYISNMNNHFDGFSINLISTEIDNCFSVSSEPKIPATGTKKEVKFSNAIDLNKDVLGYQRHLISKKEMSNLIDGNSLSLGELRSDIFRAEPILRDSGIFIFDPSVIRSGDIGNSENSIPSGLFSEEMCQLCKFIGTSSMFNRFELIFPKENLASNLWVTLYGEMIWYFLEGIFISCQDHPLVSSFQSYFVIGSDMDFEFVQSEISGRWWVKHKEDFVACAEKEYQNAANGNMSKRLSGLLT